MCLMLPNLDRAYFPLVEIVFVRYIVHIVFFSCLGEDIYYDLNSSVFIHTVANLLLVWKVSWFSMVAKNCGFHFGFGRQRNFILYTGEGMVDRAKER